MASATRAPAERRGADKGCDMAVEVVTAEIGDAPISFETGKLAKQANGAVVVRSATRWCS